MIDLFITDQTNLLPYDGEVFYAGAVLDSQQTQYYFNRLMQHIMWKHDEVVMFGKPIVTQRKAACYGDRRYQYTYSNTTKSALPWTRELRELKAIVEDRANSTFNSCLLNLYHHGGEGMAWHSDDEPSLEKMAAITSLSLGAQRKFSFKHKRTGQTLSLELENGSLLTMQGVVQNHWLHALPKSRKINEARINLTFRSMVEV